MDTPIDFAEDGRLLAAATPGPWRHGPDSTDISWDFSQDKGTRCRYGMRVSCRGAGSHHDDANAIVALRNHAAAYREAVLAASEYRLMVRPKHGDSCECNESADRLDAALARFHNITEAQS